MLDSRSRSGSAPGKWVGSIAFVLVVVGILGLGGWLLQTFVSTTTLLPIGLLSPVVIDTDKRSILVVPSPHLTQIKCAACGVVVSMRLVTVANDAAARSTMGNAEGNAVLGGLIGNLLGGSRGQDLFGWLGVIAAIRNGGVLQPGMRYETTVRFDNGASRVFVNMTRPQWRDGDRVKVVEGAIQAFLPEDAKLKVETTLSHLLPVAPVWI